MATPITVNVPHSLGKAEARRRLEEGFAGIQQQLPSVPLVPISIQQRWDGDRLHFEGGAMGQKITGRLEVLPESVQIQIDLPDLLAAVAQKLVGGLQKNVQKLLAK